MSSAQATVKVNRNTTMNETKKAEDQETKEDVDISKQYEYKQSVTEKPAVQSTNGDGGDHSTHATHATHAAVMDAADEKKQTEDTQPVDAAGCCSDIAIDKKKFAEQMSATQRAFDPQSNEAVLQRDIPNKIIVARGKKISFYYERARRILRLFDGMIVTGFGATVCVACSLVEVLRRNEMAVITHIETKFDSPINYVSINEHFNNPQQQAYYENAPPQTAIEFHLAVGKYGKYLSGYHQRKMIEVFEKYDQLTGIVSVQDVKSMNLYESFYANADQIVLADAFINDVNNLHGPDHSFILPDFIRYCSLIIHPLIKDNIFKRILSSKYGIGSSDKRGLHVNDDDDGGDRDENVVDVHSPPDMDPPDANGDGDGGDRAQVANELNVLQK